jgi:hypothetical protein
MVVINSLLIFYAIGCYTKDLNYDETETEEIPPFQTVKFIRT